jgi:hypothetical protein
MGLGFSFEALTAVMFQVEVFWLMTPCSVVGEEKMGTAWTSETSVSYHTTEDLDLNLGLLNDGVLYKIKIGKEIRESDPDYFKVLTHQ